MPVPSVASSDSGGPAFVACGARSGSTLLRFLLDAHPEIACPGETDLAVVLQGYLGVARSLGLEAGSPEDPNRRGREMIEGLWGAALDRSGKSRICDKSLSNVFHLELLASTWPEARFVLLHRHCMDFVMNGLEASPWGLAEYGFAQVAQMSPTDSVVALAAYWVDRTSRLLAFEQREPRRTLRVRYEDLVADPDSVMATVFGFLGAAPVPDITARAFSLDHSSLGGADHEIWYTSGIAADSVGEGARLPPDHVSGPLRAGVNDLLARLGYDPVDDDWGSGGGVASGDAAAPVRGPTEVELRVVHRHEVLWRRTVDLATAALVGEPGDGEPPGTLVVVVERDALAGLLGGANLGAALRRRDVRSYGRLLPFYRDEREVFGRVRAVLDAHGEDLVEHTTRRP